VRHYLATSGGSGTGSHQSASDRPDRECFYSLLKSELDFYRGIATILLRSGMAGRRSRVSGERSIRHLTEQLVSKKGGLRWTKWSA